MTSMQRVTVVLLCGSFAWLAGCASNRPTGTHRTDVEREAVVTVEAIDVPNRLVTVRQASGETMTVYVDKANKAFPQAVVGDRVRIRFVESFALRLTKPGEVSPGIQVKESTSRPQAGKPSGEASTEVTATVRIEAVNPDGSVVTFTGPRGRRTLQITDPSMREYVRKLRPSDNVEATYTEALALSLEKVAK